MVIKKAMDVFSKPGAATLESNRPFLEEKDSIFGNMGIIEISPGFRLRDMFDILIATKACNRIMANPSIAEKEKIKYSGLYADLMGGKLPKSGINILHLLQEDGTFAFDVLTATHDVFALYAASVINHPSHKSS